MSHLVPEIRRSFVSCVDIPSFHARRCEYAEDKQRERASLRDNNTVTISALLRIYVLKCSPTPRHPRDLALDRIFPPQGGNDTATRRSFLPLATLGTRYPAHHQNPIVNQSHHNAVSASAKPPLLRGDAQMSKFMQPIQVVLFTTRLTPCLPPDQAVEWLCHLWPLEDLPTVYMPSDVKPNNYASFMHHFVRGVLFRARTTVYILDTALRYLDAVRHKVPRILRQERAKQAGLQEETYEERVERSVVGTEESTHVPAWNVTRLASERRARPLLGPTSFALRVLLPLLDELHPRPLGPRYRASPRHCSARAGLSWPV